MKRLFLYLMVAISALMTGCGLFGENEQSDFEKVYTGYIMYGNVEQTNKYAYDGVNVAMRLAILLTEMKAVGLEFEGATEPDWSELGEFVFMGLPYNKKSFLFGNSSAVSIKKEGSKYYITYGTPNGLHTAGYGDVTYRIGTYCIDTADNPNLFESNSSSKWSVGIDGDSMSYALTKNSKKASFEATNVDIAMWATANNTFDYTISNSAVEMLQEKDEEETSYNDDIQYISDWSLAGSVTIPEFSNLTIEETYKTDFELSANGGGTTIVLEEYDYETTSPLIYNFLAGANYKYGGSEQVEYLGSSFVDSNIVSVDIMYNGIQVINFNGNRYEYDSEAYYYYYYDDKNNAEDEAESNEESEANKE